MKKSLIFLSLLFLSIGTVGQTSKISIGIVGSHFHNNSSSNRISEANNPYGYGVVLVRKFTDTFSMGVTFEYLEDNLEFGGGKEKDIRLHYSIYLHPLRTKYVQPYLSAGFVYTNRNLSYANSSNKLEGNKNLFNARFSAGFGIPIIANFHLNGDLGVYTDGFGYVGWGSNFGFRFSL